MSRTLIVGVLFLSIPVQYGSVLTVCDKALKKGAEKRHQRNSRDDLQKNLGQKPGGHQKLIFGPVFITKGKQ